MTYLNMSGLVSGFVEVCRGLLRFVGVCRLSRRAWGLYDALCVCAHVFVLVFVGVCRGLSWFVQPGGYMMPNREHL